MENITMDLWAVEKVMKVFYKLFNLFVGEWKYWHVLWKSAADNSKKKKKSSWRMFFHFQKWVVTKMWHAETRERTVLKLIKFSILIHSSDTVDTVDTVDIPKLPTQPTQPIQRSMIGYLLKNMHTLHRYRISYATYATYPTYPTYMQ